MDFSDWQPGRHGNTGRGPDYPMPDNVFQDFIEATDMEGVVDGDGEIVPDAFSGLPAAVAAEFPNAEIEERDAEDLAATIGYWIKLPNGYTVSVMFGPGTRSTNEQMYDLNSYHLPPDMVVPSSEQPLSETTLTAEVQAVNERREWFSKKPLEYQTLDQTLTFVRKIAQLEGQSHE